MVVVCSFVVGLAAFVRFVCDSGQIESLRLQPPPPQEGLRIGDLHNPRTGRALRAVEERAFAVNVEKYLLDKIFRFGFVPDNPLTHTSHEAGVASKKKRQRISVASLNTPDQRIVRNFKRRFRNIR